MANKAWGIRGKNPEQEAALEALLDPSIDLVVLEGIAGSGKTLLELAAGLQQVLDTKTYNHIIFTRAPCPIGDDIGFLPGTEEEKMRPWCGALEDNLDVLLGNQNKTKFDKDITDSIIQTKVKVRAMQYMRGRSLNRVYLILDEAQNLTAAQVKILLSRAGEDTKVVVLGDVHQIDNRRVNQESNGLAHLVAKGNCKEFVKIINLPAGVRSRLATFAAEEL